MRRVPDRMMPHKRLISYEPKTGESAYGPVYGPAVVCDRGAIDDKQRMITTSDGRHVMSAGRVALDPEHVVPLGSRVTVWRGTSRQRTATAVFVAVADFPRLPQFSEISLE